MTDVAQTAKPKIEMTEEMLFSLLKDEPDFECYPIPIHWFKKFNIPPREACGPKEFIESGYSIRCASAPKALSPIIINKPQRNGYTWELKPPEDIKLEIIEKPIPKAEEV